MRDFNNEKNPKQTNDRLFNAKIGVLIMVIMFIIISIITIIYVEGLR